MKHLFYILLIFLCSCTTYVPVTSYITDITFEKNPKTGKITQLITCDNEHVEEVKGTQFSMCDIGSLFTYYISGKEETDRILFMLTDGKEVDHCVIETYYYDFDTDIWTAVINVYYTDETNDLLFYLLSPKQYIDMPVYQNKKLTREQLIKVLTKLS